MNPEITPQIISQKKAILDIYMNMGQVEVDIEMQKSRLSPFVNRRFMHYASKLISYQLKPGQSSGSLKNLIQIIFIEDIDKRNPCLIDRYCSRNLLLNKQLGYIQTTIYIYLPYINKITNNKILNEWEAIIYLLHNGELDNIDYEKGEMIEMLEKKYAEFSQDESLIKETSLRYYTEVDLNEWHDYDVKVAKEEGVVEGIEMGKIEALIYLIKEKYNENALWLYECTPNERDQIMHLYVRNADYEQLMKVKNSH